MPLSDIQNGAARAGLELTLSTIRNTKNQTIVIVGVYRPPSAKASWFSEFNEIILQLLNIGQMIIMGDTNADLLKPRAQPAKSLRSSLKLANTRIESINPTRIQGNSTTCLDIIAVDTGLDCADYSIGDMAASDHFPVMATVTLSVCPPLKPILKRNYKKINMQELRYRLDLINVDPNSAGEVNDLVTTWHKQVINILDVVAPRRELPI